MLQSVFAAFQRSGELVIVLLATGVLIASAVMPSYGDSRQADAHGSGEAFLNLASHIPVQDAERGVSFFDFAHARSLTGVKLPPANASQAELRAYAEELLVRVVPPPWGSPLARFYSSSNSDWNHDVGFTIRDFDQAIWISGSATMPSLTVAEGRFEPARVGQALQGSSSFAGYVTSGQHDGTPFFTWAKPVALVPLWPKAGGLTAQDGIVTWSESQELLVRSIATSGTSRLSLLRLPELQQIASAFDQLGVYSAYFEFSTSADWANGIRWLQEGEYGRDFVRAQLALEPFDSIVVGVGQTAVSPAPFLMLVHADAEAAQANVQRLKRIVETGTSFHTRRPWKDIVSDVSIRAERNLLIARFQSSNPRLTFDAWQNLDSFFLQQPADQ